MITRIAPNDATCEEDLIDYKIVITPVDHPSSDTPLICEHHGEHSRVLASFCVDSPSHGSTTYACFAHVGHATAHLLDVIIEDLDASPLSHAFHHECGWIGPLGIHSELKRLGPPSECECGEKGSVFHLLPIRKVGGP